jgi:small subunit ribosomal protein S18
MARTNDRDRNPKRAPKETRPRGKRKVCVFCKEHADYVDYKDVNLLRRFMSERGKIRSRRVTGNCTQHQRDVQVAIKTARELALLPYVQRTASERGPGRPRPAAGREGTAELEDAAVPEQAADYDLDGDAEPDYVEANNEPELAEVEP